MQIQEILLHHLFTGIDICTCIYALDFLKDIYETFAGIYDGTKIELMSKICNLSNGNNKEALLVF